MKEYDIYLKQRLHESKLFIYSIPYRDGVSVTNRILLEAMLQYYTLQKLIAVENKSELVAEIDDILAIVHERIGNSMGIQISAEFLTRYYNELEQNAIELNIPDLPAFLRSFIDVRDALGIHVSDVDVIAKGFLGEHLDNAIVFAASDLTLDERMFGQAKSAMTLRARIGKTHKHDFEVVNSGLVVDTPPVDLFYCYSTGLETAMSIVAHITDIEIHYSLGDANSAMAILTSEPETSAVKHITISNEIELFCEMAATVISYFQADSGMAIRSSVSAGMKRYRLLEELDDMTLEEMDNMTLEELDYVWLT